MNYRRAGLATSLGSGCLSVPRRSAAAFYFDITGGGGRRRGAGGCPGSEPCLPGPVAGLARLGPLDSRGAHTLQVTPAFSGPRKHFCSQGCNLRKPGMSLFGESPSQASTQTPAPPSTHTSCTCCRWGDVLGQTLSGTQAPMCTHMYKIHTHSHTTPSLPAHLAKCRYIPTSVPHRHPFPTQALEFLVYSWPVTSKPFASENATRKARGLSLTRVGEGTLVAVCALRRYLS